MKTTISTLQDKVDPIRNSQLEDSALQEKVSNRIDELLAILDKDIQHIQESLSWLNELRSLVIKRNDTALSQLMQTIRTEADSYSATESKRQLIRKALADIFGCSVKKVTLSMLQNVLPEEQKAQVEDRKTKLRTLIKELRKEHLSTAMLLSDCAKFNNQLLKALFELGDKGTTFYQPDGATKRRNDTTFVNMRL